MLHVLKKALKEDTNLKTLMDERDKDLRKCRETKKEVNCSRYKRLRKQTKSIYHRNLINENCLNPNKFWATIKHVFPSKSSNINPTLRPITNTKTNSNISRLLQERRERPKEKCVANTRNYL